MRNQYMGVVPSILSRWYKWLQLVRPVVPLNNPPVWKVFLKPKFSPPFFKSPQKPRTLCSLPWLGLHAEHLVTKILTKTHWGKMALQKGGRWCSWNWFCWGDGLWIFIMGWKITIFHHQHLGKIWLELVPSASNLRKAKLGGGPRVNDVFPPVGHPKIVVKIKGVSPKNLLKRIWLRNWNYEL